MKRWSTSAGIAISAFAFVVLIVIGLTGEGPDPATQPDLRNGRAFIQDNLWTANGRQYAVWVGHDGTPYAGWRRVGGGEWHTDDLSRLDGDPLATPTAEDNHTVYALGVDAEGEVHVAGNMHNDPLRYVRDLHRRARRLDDGGRIPPPARASPIRRSRRSPTARFSSSAGRASPGWARWSSMPCRPEHGRGARSA